MPGIIVGVDGSSPSQRALQWALSEAAARHAPITVLSVRHDRAVTYATGDLTQDQAAEEVLALADQAVGRRSGPVPPVTVRMMPGWPAAELLDAGHGATCWSWARVAAAASAGGGAGSVSRQVAYDVLCPVVIIFQPVAASHAGKRDAAQFP